LIFSTLKSSVPIPTFPKGEGEKKEDLDGAFYLGQLTFRVLEMFVFLRIQSRKI
jgi:hypothetical protein